MTLFDVDKTSVDRGAPTPNHSDIVTEDAVKAHQTLSSSYKTDAVSTPSRMIFKNNMTLYYDDQGRVIKVDGFIPSLANYPVTIQAKYGYDVFVDILGISAP